MFEMNCALIVIVTGGAALYVFFRTRDPVHPAVFLAPLFAYFYGIWPILLNRNGQLQELILESDLIHTSLVFLLSIGALYIGLLHRPRARPARNGASFVNMLGPDKSKRLFRLALIMGGLAVLAYLSNIWNVGGFWAAYSHGKGGGRAYTGYVGEAILLSYPALLVLALAVRARGGKFDFNSIAVALIIASPHLIQGTLGGRRGPLFLILSTMLFTYFVARGRIPSLKTITISVCAIAMMVVVVASQRKFLYLGTEHDFDMSRVFVSDGLNFGEVNRGNSYVTAVAMIVAADFFEDYYWGKRFFVSFFIRPIPKQLWPTKYRDMGARWLYVFGDDGSGFGRFARAIGFAIPGGASGGAIADGYIEFAWGVVLMFFVLGRVFSFAYWKHRREGGFWSILFYLMIALSIYLPTQSFSAWLHRLLFMSGFGYMFWRLVMDQGSKPGGSTVGPRP